MSNLSRQLTFELAQPSAPTFDNFVAGPNAEAVATLIRAAEGASHDAGIVLWGASGAGKSHLLQASVTAVRGKGRVACYFAHPAEVGVADAEPAALVAVDALDQADEAAQSRLFTLYNAIAAGGGQLIAAASAPPAHLPVRDDLRTRLGWGLVYEIVALADPDLPAALLGFARERGFRLSRDAIDYLLAHGRRDMRSLVQALIALDRDSLAQKRPITVPLIRDWLNAGK